MLFVPLMLFGVALYFTKWRVWSGVIFFFFISRGFQLVPEVLFDTGMVISKSADFGLFYMFFVLLIGSFRCQKLFVLNKITIAIFVFLLFVLFSCLYSRFHLYVTWTDIMRTSRYFFFVLAYFIFRRFTKEETLDLLKIVFTITLISCSFYVLQSVTGIPFLAGGKVGKFGFSNRYYNIPILFYVFVIYALLCNPYKGFWKYYSIIIFCLTAVLSQHRGLMIAIFIATFWGIYILEGGLKGIVKYLFIGGIALMPVFGMVLDRFAKNETSSDIESVVEGAFTDHSGEVEIGGTFAFRIALLYERAEYVFENPKSIIMGVGMMTEGSELADRKFDFIIGLVNEETGRKVQLDTSDIAWMPFLLRLGLLGTILFLSIYFLLAQFFFQNRKDPLMLSFFSFIILLLINSMASTELYDAWMMVPALMGYAMKKQELEKAKDSEVESIIEEYEDGHI